jgi:hypothetical protein
MLRRRSGYCDGDDLLGRRQRLAEILRRALRDVQSIVAERITHHGLESRFCGVEFPVMRKSIWTPSIVPRGDDHDIYLVVDDLGKLGRIWRDADYEATDFETVITDLLDGQYRNPLGIYGFNTAEGWSQDVSADVAADLRRRCDLQLRDVPSGLQDFVDRHDAIDRAQLALPLRLAWPDR